MKVLHVADTHLGYAAYNKVDLNGLNQREVDVYNAFTATIDIALKEKVDAVVHAGDLFDSVRPSNRAVANALTEIQRLAEKDIPFIAISGNHETPRLRETGSVFSILSVLDNVHGAYRGTYETIVVDDLHVHAIPHCPTKEVFKEELAKLKPSKGNYQIAMLHAGVVGVDVFSMGEANENTASIGPLTQKAFDYVALGHYHKHTSVADRVVYAGSCERLSFSEAKERKGCVLVDLDKHKWEFKEVYSRPMLDIGPLEWDGQSSSDIGKEVVDLLEKQGVDDKIVRLTMEKIPRSVYAAMDHKRIREAASKALFFQPRFVFVDEDQQVAPADMAIRSLQEEYGDFMGRYHIEHLDKKRLEALGRDYLSSSGGGK